MMKPLAVIGVLLLSASLSLAATTKKSPPAAPARKTEAPAPVPAAAAIKQGDFARLLVDTLGWGEGLPEKPEDKDYLAILGGNRTFRFEAEETFDRKNDTVVVRNYPLFGTFTGKGWLHGPTSPNAVHFTVFIPIPGTYTLKAATKGDGQIWSIAGKAFKLNGGESLKEQTLGQLFIPAGSLEFNVVIPPGGAIDYYSLEASPFQAVAPLAGWDFSAPLTRTALNEIAASLLASEQNLPVDPAYAGRTIDVATAATIPAEALLTDTQIYGRPTSGKWIRATQHAATISIPFEADATGVYSVRLRALGATVTAGIDQVLPTVAGKQVLDWIDLGTFRLAKGSHVITVKLPPAGGLDAVAISRRLTTAEAYAAIVKTAPGEPLIQKGEPETIVKSLQEQFKERK